MYKNYFSLSYLTINILFPSLSYWKKAMKWVTGGAKGRAAVNLVESQGPNLKSRIKSENIFSRKKPIFGRKCILSE